MDPLVVLFKKRHVLRCGGLRASSFPAEVISVSKFRTATDATRVLKVVFTALDRGEKSLRPGRGGRVFLPGPAIGVTLEGAGKTPEPRWPVVSLVAVSVLSCGHTGAWGSPRALPLKTFHLSLLWRNSQR